jgi:Rrf2 family protein
VKLQKASSFALFAVLELAADPTRQLSGIEIAEKYGISAHHLAKVLRDLGRAGIVDGARGVGGGYRLVANPKRLTLFDVIQVFEPVGSDSETSSGSKSVTDAESALRLILDELDDHMVATFRSITFSTMLKLMTRRPWARAARLSTSVRKAVARG